MSFYSSPSSGSNLKFNSPKTWRPDNNTNNTNNTNTNNNKNNDELITPLTPEKNDKNIPTKSPSSTSLPRANSALFTTLGFDLNDDIGSDDSSGDEIDDKFSIPSPRKSNSNSNSNNSNSKSKEDVKKDDSKMVPIEQVNQLKALVAEKEKERDQALAAKLEYEMNSKQTQKHQLGILRDSFKKQMDDKDRKIEDLELILAESASGASDSTSTAVVSLKLKIEKLEKEKQTLESKITQQSFSSSTDISRTPSSSSLTPSSSFSSVTSSQFESSQKELKLANEAKAKLEVQLEKTRNELYQMQNEKDLSAKELLATRTEIDMLLNNTKSGSDTVNEERKKNFELTEKLSDQKKEMEKLENKIASLETKLTDETSRKSADSDEKNSKVQNENSKLESENSKLKSENEKFTVQIEKFEKTKSDLERKISEMDLRIGELVSDKERLSNSNSNSDQRASEIERIVDSERSKNVKLNDEINALKKERDEAQTAGAKVSETLSEVSLSKKELEAELQKLTSENKAHVSTLERDLKDLQDNQAKMKDLYSRQMNESSSSFEGERGELLNNVSDLQSQIQSLKNAMDEKEKLLRDAARSSEKLEQASLQKDSEIREKSDLLAVSKSESESRKTEISTTREELAKLQKQADEYKREVESLRDERKSLSAGSVSERESNERDKKDLHSQFDKEKTKLTKQIEELQEERQKLAEESKRETQEAARKLADLETVLENSKRTHAQEIEDAKKSHSLEISEAKKTHANEVSESKKAHANEIAESKKTHANEVSELRKSHAAEISESKNSSSMEISEIKKSHSQEVAELKKVHLQANSDSEKARKEEREKLENMFKEEKEGMNKKMDDYREEVKREKNQRETEVKKENEDTKAKHQKENEDAKAKHQKEIEELKAKYQKEMDKLVKEREDEKAKLQVASASLNDFKGKMSKILTTMASEIRTLKQSLAKVRSQAEDNQKSIPNVVQLLAKTISKATAKLDKTASSAIKKYKKEVIKSRKLYNEIQELKGNIRVYCRVRPLNGDELARNDENVVTFPEESLMHINNPQTNHKKAFEFEKIYSPELNQEAIFKDTQPLITSVVDGYNVCIFAYGQTGSGKTYTMEGTKDSPGVNMRALNELFRVTQERSTDYKFEITVSVLEIYNETIHDLLVKPPKGNVTPIKYEIKQGPNGMYVPDLTSVQVHSTADVLRVMTLGNQHRATSSTNMNEHSSRSHALLSVVVTTQNLISGTINIGKLTLVDLAGSERVSKSGVTKERMTEAQNINKSLSALGDVIAALAQKNAHIPYRNSKLTYLLQDSLGGDSKTLMFVQISPSSDNVGETLCSLNFAARVRSVELGQAKKHVGDASTADVAKMKAQIKKLEDQLQSPERSGSPASDSSPRVVKKKIVPKT